jgi:hypothetical protein
MKLITEDIDYANLQIINEGEEVVDGEKKKIWRLKGLMLEAEAKNKNKRWYSKPILEREVKNFNEKIKKGNAVGTADHDKSPNVQLDRISHKIESLVMEGNQVYGTLRVLNKTKMGKEVRAILEEGIPLGVSSRGVGTLTFKNKNGDVIKPNKEGKLEESPDLIEVNPDFQLLSIDCVLSPSCQNAMLEAVTESTEWLLTESGLYVQKENNYHVDKSISSKKVLGYLNDFLDSIRKKI